MKKTLKYIFPDIVDVIVSLFLVIGINFWFAGCGPKEDGSWMTCHWAEVIVKTISYILLGLSLIKTALPNRQIRVGLSGGMFAISLLMTLVPGTLIKLCMMDSMACNSLMKPYTIMFGVIFMVLEFVEITLTLLINRSKK